MTIECKRCGGPTLPETVVKLQRGLIGFRETRWQGGYCVACGLSVPTQAPATVRSKAERQRGRLGGLMVGWSRGTLAGSACRGLETLDPSGPVRHSWRTARMPP